MNYDELNEPEIAGLGMSDLFIEGVNYFSSSIDIENLDQ